MYGSAYAEPERVYQNASSDIQHEPHVHFSLHAHGVPLLWPSNIGTLLRSTIPTKLSMHLYWIPQACTQMRPNNDSFLYHHAARQEEAPRSLPFTALEHRAARVATDWLGYHQARRRHVAIQEKAN